MRDSGCRGAMVVQRRTKRTGTISYRWVDCIILLIWDGRRAIGWDWLGWHSPALITRRSLVQFQVDPLSSSLVPCSRFWSGPDFAHPRSKKLSRSGIFDAAGESNLLDCPDKHLYTQ
jgi:hypothetical protein